MEETKGNQEEQEPAEEEVDQKAEEMKRQAELAQKKRKKSEINKNPNWYLYDNIEPDVAIQAKAPMDWFFGRK